MSTTTQTRPSKTRFENGTVEWSDQRGCECVFHRYHVVHICECGHLYSHSQNDCNKHRGHLCINFPAGEYRHGWSSQKAFDDLAVKGALPYGTEAFEKVYAYFAEGVAETQEIVRVQQGQQKEVAA